MTNEKPKREMLKFTDANGAGIMMLPAGAGRCEICNHEHPPEFPHNAQTVFYQMRFYYENGGRWPSWADAIAHCPPEIKERWTRELEAMKVNIGSELAETRQADLDFEIMPGHSIRATVTLPAGLEITDAELQAAADSGNDGGESFTRILNIKLEGEK